MLTIAYFTSRKEPMTEWFFQSLAREVGRNAGNVRIVIVDFWKQPMLDLDWSEDDVRYRSLGLASEAYGAFMSVSHFHVAPKPTVWQGVFKRPKAHWWAASNARNTAICLAPDGWIAFVDDLSVLMPGWLKAVCQAIDGDQRTITLGAYKKVKNLIVKSGNVVSFDEYAPGVDSRWGHGSDAGPVPIGSNCLFGCSLVSPVEAFLEINGFNESADGMGFEDVLAGICLAKRGYKLQYDRRMLTLESEERHHTGFTVKKSDFGVSPNDKSHAILKMTQQGDGTAPNYFDPGGIRALRQKILAGESFPICRIPEHEFFTGARLEDL